MIVNNACQKKPSMEFSDDRGSRTLRSSWNSAEPTGHHPWNVTVTMPAWSTMEFFRVANMRRSKLPDGMAAAQNFQSFVQLQCLNDQPESSWSDDGKYIQFAPGNGSFDKLIKWSDVNLTSGYSRTKDRFLTFSMVNEREPEIGNPTVALFWVTTPEGLNRTLLVAGEAFNRSNNRTEWKYKSACTINAYWKVAPVMAGLVLEDADGADPASFEPSPDLLEADFFDSGRTWLPSILDTYRSYQGTFYRAECLVSAVAMFATFGFSERGMNLVSHYESDFATYNRSSGRWQDSLDPAVENAVVKWLKDNGTFGEYTRIMVRKNQSNTDFSSWLSFPIQIYRRGSGFEASTTTRKLSLAVLFAYATTVMTYVIYIFCIGSTIGGWATISELVMLAINSERPTDLHNTSVGVDKLGTYQQIIQVQVNKKDSVEMVFVHDSAYDATRYSPLRPNEAY